MGSRRSSYTACRDSLHCELTSGCCVTYRALLTLHSNDIRVAACTLSQPRFPLPSCIPWIHLNFSRGDRRASDPGAIPLAAPDITSVTFIDKTESNPGWTLTGIEFLDIPGAGFRNAFYMLGMQLAHVQTFVDFATLSLLLEHHKTSNILLDLPNHVLLDATIGVLHQLLSIPIREVSADGNESALYLVLRACRLAVLLYSFRHLFPLPRSAFPFLSMIQSLEVSITQAVTLDARQSVHRALFWCAMVGAKASIGSPESGSFLALLRTISSPWGIRNEQAALPLLQTFAWPDSAHDPGFWSPPIS